MSCEGGKATVKETGDRDGKEKYSVVGRRPSSDIEHECVTKTFVKSDKCEK